MCNVLYKKPLELTKVQVLKVIISHDECPYIYSTHPKLLLLMSYRRTVSFSSARATQQDYVIKNPKIDNNL